MNHLPKDVARCSSARCPKAAECARFMDVPFQEVLTWAEDLCDYQAATRTGVFPEFIPLKLLAGATRIDL